MVRVDIALATYEGARFLPEQIDSILSQSHSEWRLIARDDGSDDETPEILEQFRRRHPDRITVLRDGDTRLGHARNFARLLEHCHGPYVALCDQDDFWLPDKLRSSLEELQQIERRKGAATPALVFTDAVVVDADRRTIAPSFWAYTHIRPEDASVPSRLLYANVVAAHTMLLNAALRDLTIPLPPSVLFVDWWIALLAACAGETSFVAEPTVLHRQHAANTSGAHPPRTVSVRSGLEYLGRWQGTARERALRYRQAEALRERAGGRMDGTTATALEAFLSLPELSVVERVRRARDHGLLPRDVARSAIFVLTAPSWTSGETQAEHDVPDR